MTLFSSDMNSTNKKHDLNDDNNAIRSSSPYDVDQTDFSSSAATLAQLESQSQETMGVMGLKISALKDLSLKMEQQIKKSEYGLNHLSEDMTLSSDRIKWNMNRMKTFVEKSGVSWKVWFLFGSLIMFIFMWVWLF